MKKYIKNHFTKIYKKKKTSILIAITLFKNYTLNSCINIKKN